MRVQRLGVAVAVVNRRLGGAGGEQRPEGGLARRGGQGRAVWIEIFLDAGYQEAALADLGVFALRDEKRDLACQRLGAVRVLGICREGADAEIG